MNTDFLCEKFLQQKNPYYSELVKNTAVVIYHALEKYKLYFPEFSDHSILHSLQVMDFCNRLIVDTIYEMNEDEVYILIMAAYLHDIGMGISEKDYDTLYDEVVTEEYRMTYPDSSVRETIRSFHHIFSKHLILKYASLLDIPSEEHAQAIAAVSEGHRKVALHLEEVSPGVMIMPNGNPVRLPYLSALIRLADELNIAADRNLEADAYVSGDLFMQIHQSIRHLHIEPEEFLLDVVADDPSLFDSILKEINKLGDTLQYCRQVVEQRTPFEISQKSVRISRIPSGLRSMTVLDTDLSTKDAYALYMLKELPVQPEYIVASCENYVSVLPCQDGTAAADNASLMDFDQLLDRMRDADAITYIATGPLSSLEKVIDEPELCSKITGIYVSSCRIGKLNCSHNRDPEFSMDPKIVRKLLESKCNLTLFPPDITGTGYLTAYGLDEAILRNMLPILYISYPEHFELTTTNVKSDEYGNIYEALLGPLIHVCTSIKEDLVCSMKF